MVNYRIRSEYNRLTNKQNQLIQFRRILQMKAANVYYDPQQNSYFKIDKQTGETRKTHRNGSEFFRFKPDYSGIDYQKRKSHQKDLSPPILSKPAFQVKYPHKHTVPVQQLRRQTRSQAIISQAPLVDMQASLVGYQSRILESKFSAPVSQLHQKLKQFNKIKQDLRRQNHSPRKGYEGSIPTEKLSSEYKNEVIKGLRQSNAAHRKSGSIINRTIEASSNMVLKDQLLKQRQIFLRYNSNYRPQQNERQQKQQRERKTNLKILQKLFIQKNNKQTCSIYE